ncbi:MAG: hypothetical protein BMS9Abin19_0038 [Gammaproteobacteria bacterium]|nr:MAG: hypothetical protein BMS9Abin19_0038 [Gammaproteobacteria bacterium]
MIHNINPIRKFACILSVSLATASCVTETVNSPNSMKFSDTAVIAVQDPNIFVIKGSTFAWLPEAVRFYKDERLESAPIKALIEKEITRNLLAKEVILVESVNGAKFAIAYTAALESSLDDTAIIRRFGLLPGNTQVPQDDSNIEKGTLIVYVFENKTNDIVWRSAAQVSVKFDMPIDERKARVERVLAEMFQTFTVTE